MPERRSRSWFPAVAGAGGLLLLAAVVPAAPVQAHEFPTEASADYVFGCMASNGQTREMLQSCSCSIDVIASVVPYERYVQAETILRMRQIGGEKSALFREGSVYKQIVDELRNAQAEAELKCF